MKHKNYAKLNYKGHKKLKSRSNQRQHNNFLKQLKILLFDRYPIGPTFLFALRIIVFAALAREYL